MTGARAIERLVQTGLDCGDPERGADEWEAPRMLALAEAVAAGLGRPSDELLPEHAAGCAAQADLLAEFRDAALAAIPPVLAGPYPEGWRGPEGPHRFRAAVEDLRGRLRAGRTAPLAPPQDRFLRALGPLLQPRGWQPATADQWRRPAPGGHEQVAVRFRHRAGRTSALVWVARTFDEDNARLREILGSETPARDTVAAVHRPPRGLWDRLGERGWVALHHTDDPAGEHRESTVRLAAEKSAAWVGPVGEALLRRYRGDRLAAFLREISFDQLRRLAPAETLLVWLLVAQREAPDTVDRLAEERRTQLARVSNEQRRHELLGELDRVQAACRGG
jgi:hypothetical protein